MDKDELLVAVFRILYELAVKQERMCKQQDLCILVFSVLLATVMVGVAGTIMYYIKYRR